MLARFAQNLRLPSFNRSLGPTSWIRSLELIRSLRTCVMMKRDGWMLRRWGALFQVSVRAIAKAAGITRQALDENPDSEKAQPVLKLFAERFAELAHTFFCDYLINLLDTNETFFYHT